VLECSAEAPLDDAVGFEAVCQFAGQAEGVGDHPQELGVEVVAAEAVLGALLEEAGDVGGDIRVVAAQDQVGLEDDPVDAPPLARAAALGLQGVGQPESDAPALVQALDVGVEDRQVLGIEIRTGDEHINAGLDDVTYAVDIQEPVLIAVGFLPGSARPDAE